MCFESSRLYLFYSIPLSTSQLYSFFLRGVGYILQFSNNDVLFGSRNYHDFFLNLFIYFIYGCVGSSFLCEGFL